MNEWWIIDTRTNEIVNCCTMRGGPPDLGRWVDPEHLRTTLTPTQAQLEAYQYWSERP